MDSSNSCDSLSSLEVESMLAPLRITPVQLRSENQTSSINFDSIIHCWRPVKDISASENSTVTDQVNAIQSLDFKLQYRPLREFTEK